MSSLAKNQPSSNQNKHYNHRLWKDTTSSLSSELLELSVCWLWFRTGAQLPYIGVIAELWLADWWWFQSDAWHGDWSVLSWNWPYMGVIVRKPMVCLWDKAAFWFGQHKQRHLQFATRLQELPFYVCMQLTRLVCLKLA